MEDEIHKEIIKEETNKKINEDKNEKKKVKEKMVFKIDQNRLLGKGSFGKIYAEYEEIIRRKNNELELIDKKFSSRKIDLSKHQHLEKELYKNENLAKKLGLNVYISEQSMESSTNLKKDNMNIELNGDQTHSEQIQTNPSQLQESNERNEEENKEKEKEEENEENEANEGAEENIETEEIKGEHGEEIINLEGPQAYQVNIDENPKAI